MLEQRSDKRIKNKIYTNLIQKLDQFGAAFFSQHWWWIDRSPQIWIAENNSASAYILGVAPSDDVVTRRIIIVFLGDANISLLTFICHWHPGVDPIIKYKYMDVSENSGTPKSSILIGISIINHPFWGAPIFGNNHIKCKTLPNRCTNHKCFVGNL